LFVRELARLSSAGDPLPAGIRDVIGQRLAQLSPEVRSVLSAASVLGHSFPAALLGVLVDLPAADVLDLLDQAGVVASDGPVLRFDDVLIQEPPAPLRADRREPRHAHPDQARFRLAHPHRRLVRDAPAAPMSTAVSVCPDGFALARS